MRIIVSILLLFCLSTVDAKIYAVVVGVEKYDGTVSNLGATVDDSDKMFSYLNTGKKNKIVYLTDEKATKENILYAMDKTFALAKKGDMIVFYFAGHGAPGIFCPHNFQAGNNPLLHTEIQNAFKKSKAKHKLVIADACYSGSIKKKADSNYAAGDAKNNQNVVIFMSSREDETSLENRYLNAGFFTYYLVNGMNGKADDNADNGVSLYELYVYVRKNVRSATDNQQTPVMFGQFNKDAIITTY